VDNKNKKKKRMVISFGIVAIVLLGIVLCFVMSRNMQTQFSTQEWTTVREKTRYRMLDDLLASYHLEGMTTNEIEDLLGEESVRHEAWASEAGSVDFHWGYDIRYDKWNGWELLLIGFKDNVVVKYELVYLSDL